MITVCNSSKFEIRFGSILVSIGAFLPTTFMGTEHDNDLMAKIQALEHRVNKVNEENALLLRLMKDNPPFSTHPDAGDFLTLAELEKRYIISVLKLTGWRVSGVQGAARILGLNAKTLDSKMRKLKITRPKKAS